MARLGRYFLPGQPLHVIQRGNNRGAIFFDPAQALIGVRVGFSADTLPAYVLKGRVT